MTFKEMSARVFEPVSQWLMILGIIALLQPWSLFLHRYGITIVIVGLLTFMFTNWFGKPDDAQDGVFDVSDRHEGKS